MIVQNIDDQLPFTTADGSTIRSILDRSNAPVHKQSLAEASLREGKSTDSHYHRLSEEFYFILEGEGTMTVDNESQQVGPGDAVVIPMGKWHQIEAITDLRFLCCCAPPYSHDDTYFE